MKLVTDTPKTQGWDPDAVAPHRGDVYDRYFGTQARSWLLVLVGALLVIAACWRLV